MRVLVFIAALLLAALGLSACTGLYAAGATAEDNAPGDGCVEDLDCVLAGPSCCDCPTYATGIDSGWLDSCGTVDCPPPTSTTCAPLVAQCVERQCVATCAAIACDLSCPTGFAMDASGCLTCACAPSGAPAACQSDDQCVQTRADCCGCARGGVDTAVLAGTAADYDRGLGCPADASQVACPDVATCDPAQVPRCVFGQCQLADAAAPPPTLPPEACGRPDLPPCPAGTTCVINSDDAAGPLGVGVCAPSMP